MPDARYDAEAGHLLFGTIDTWVLWNLTQEQVHATDYTNASRTMLFNLHRQCWDDDMLRLWRIPALMLPEVHDNGADFGNIDASLFGVSAPILGIAGDQQAALIGQACIEPGMAKSTYGTGCFVLLNTGNLAVASRNRLLTTVAYRLDGQVTFALEGSIFNAGATMQWLRDRLKLLTDTTDSERIAAALADNGGVYLVPAFTGLGAPQWNPDARGTIVGLTRDSGAEHVVRAGLEAVAYQTRDLVQAMMADGGKVSRLRVDGGMTANNWLMQFLADIVDLPVDRPPATEATAWGAAYLAGMQAGIYPPLARVGEMWRREREFVPLMQGELRKSLLVGWEAALRKTMG